MDETAILVKLIQTQNVHWFEYKMRVSCTMT